MSCINTEDEEQKSSVNTIAMDDEQDNIDYRVEVGNYTNSRE